MRTRSARILVEVWVVLLTIVLYNGVIFWGSFLFGRTVGASLGEVLAAPFWLPVLYTVASPWYALPFVLFALAHSLTTARWPSLRERTGLRVMIAAGIALISMGITVGVAELRGDEDFDFMHGFPPVWAMARFALGAVLAVLIMSPLVRRTSVAGRH